MRVGLVAGEVSGDLLGGGLIEAIRARHPDARFEGVGGDMMRAAGMECWYDAEALAVMGLTEVLVHLPRLLRLRRDLVRRWTAEPPDVLVGIDAPDFNLGLELKLRRRGVRTVHYVSPSVWAWRQRRVRKVRRACDRVLCLLPFEPAFYADHGVAADFVGHPLAQRIAPESDATAARAALSIDGDGPVLAVLPGSRLGEISRLGADFAAAAQQFSAAHPGTTVLVPLATPAGADAFRAIVADLGVGDNFRVSVGDARGCMAACDLLLMASGTATLEGLLHGRPMVVAYRLATSTYRILRAFNLVKLKHFSLPNLLTPEPLVAEVLQDDVTPERLASELSALVSSPQRASTMRAAFRDVHTLLARNADERAAELVLATAMSA
ncbi:MAG: lipid-A-disaccharide synthase [Pseudomonadota bacterium]